MRTLTTLYSAPRRVTFGGEDFDVGELRVCDLARLQEWLDARAPDPLAVVGPLLHARFVEPADRIKFSEAIDLAATGMLAWGDEKAGEAMTTIEGTFAFLKVVLGRDRPKKDFPEFTDEHLVELMERWAPGDVDAVERAAWRTPPGEALDRAVARLTGAPRLPSGGPTPDWPEWVDRVARSHAGWTYEYIAGLTLTQFFVALNEGKAPRKAAPAERPGAARARWDRWIAGDDRGRDRKGAG